MQSSFPARLKFSRAMGIRFSYFSIVVIVHPAGAYSLINNAEKPMAQPTSRTDAGFFTASSNLIKLCISVLIIGTLVFFASFSISSKKGVLPGSRELINAVVRSSPVIPPHLPRRFLPRRFLPHRRRPDLPLLRNQPCRCFPLLFSFLLPVPPP